MNRIYMKKNITIYIISGKEVSLEGIDNHLIAGLVKAYFIALPEPLFTFASYDSFIEAAGLILLFFFKKNIEKGGGLILLFIRCF